MSAARLSPGCCACFTCLCIATYAALYLTSDFDLFSAAGVAEGFPALPLGVVLGAVVGALILSRYPHNRIGWLLSIGQAGSGLGLAAGAYAYRVLVEHELRPGRGRPLWPRGSRTSSAPRTHCRSCARCSCSSPTAGCSPGAGARSWRSSSRRTRFTRA